MGYDFEILYQLRLNNKAAYALSRILPEAKLRILSSPTLLDISVVEKEVRADDEL